MKKLFCIIALAAISFGSVFAAVPVHNTKTTMLVDTVMKKKMKVETDTTKIKMNTKKDTTKM
jgi:hypothetical protein